MPGQVQGEQAVNPVVREIIHGASVGAWVGVVVGASEAIYLVNGGADVRLVFTGSLLYAIVGMVGGFGLGLFAGCMPFWPFVRPGSGAATAFSGAVAAFIVVVLRVLPNLGPGDLVEKLQDAVCVILAVIGILVAFIGWLAPRFGEEVKRSIAMPVTTLSLNGFVVGACVYFQFTSVQVVATADPAAFAPVYDMPDRLLDKPNTLFIVVHGLRSNAVGAYNPEVRFTPTIDGLARSGILFEQAMATSSATTPALSSLVTGRDIRAHGVRRPGEGLSRQVPTLFGAQQRAGIITAAVYGHPDVSSATGLDRGFDFVLRDGAAPPPDSGDWRSALWTMSVPRLLHSVVEQLRQPAYPAPPRYDSRPDFRYDRAYDRIPSAPVPRLAQVARAGAPPRVASDPRSALALATRFTEAKRGGRWSLLVHLDIPSGTTLVGDRQAAYADGVRQLDASLGRFFRRFEELGLDRDTLVVLTADHGTELDDHGGFGFGTTLHDAVLRVPLVIRMPGRVHGGARFVGQVRALDAFVTAMEVQGVRLPPGVLGRSIRGERSLLADLQENSPRNRPSLCKLRELGRIRRLYAEVDTGARRIRAYRSSGYKLIRTDTDRAAPEFQLFDVLSDPAETSDLYDTDDQQCGRSLREIQRQMESLITESTASTGPAEPDRGPRRDQTRGWQLPEIGGGVESATGGRRASQPRSKLRRRRGRRPDEAEALSDDFAVPPQVEGPR